MATNIETLEHERRDASLRMARARRYPDKVTPDEFDELQRRYAVAKCKWEVASTLAEYPSLTGAERREIRNLVRDLP